MNQKLELVSWRFLGGSVEIDKSVDPPEAVMGEVMDARTLLFQPYPGILPNISRQFCKASNEFNKAKRGWINVPLHASGLRMMAIYFVYQRSRAFWNGLEMVYEPTPGNTKAICHLMAYEPEQLWSLWPKLPQQSGGAVDIVAISATEWDGKSAALNFPRLEEDGLYTGVVPVRWKSFVHVLRNGHATQEVRHAAGERKRRLKTAVEDVGMRVKGVMGEGVAAAKDWMKKKLKH